MSMKLLLARQALARLSAPLSVEDVFKALGAVLVGFLLCVAALVVAIGTLLHAVSRPVPLPGVGPSAHLGEIPPDILAMLPRAAAACPGLPWPILACSRIWFGLASSRCSSVLRMICGPRSQRSAPTSRAATSG